MKVTSGGGRVTRAASGLMGGKDNLLVPDGAAARAALVRRRWRPVRIRAGKGRLGTSPLPGPRREATEPRDRRSADDEGSNVQFSEAWRSRTSGVGRQIETSRRSRWDPRDLSSLLAGRAAPVRPTPRIATDMNIRKGKRPVCPTAPRSSHRQSLSARDKAVWRARRAVQRFADVDHRLSSTPRDTEHSDQCGRRMETELRRHTTSRISRRRKLHPSSRPARAHEIPLNQKTSPARGITAAGG